MPNENNKKPTLSASFENSSNIALAEYDPFMKVLSLKFRKGGEYDYLEVEEKVFIEMKKSESAGKFFHSNIRGKYDFFKKVTKNSIKQEINEHSEQDEPGELL